MNMLSRFFKKSSSDNNQAAVNDIQQPSVSAKSTLAYDIDALYNLLTDIEGADRLVIKASHLEALEDMRSEELPRRLLALQKIIYEDPSLVKPPTEEEMPKLLEELMEYLAKNLARKTIEEQLEKRINAKMEENHQEYIEDIRKQIIKEEAPTEDSPQAKEKLAKLEALDKVQLTKSILELLRPHTLEEVIGQERAIAALKAKLSSPYPQHLILYGPPGVGKTTAARLALDIAAEQSSSAFAKGAPFVESNATTLRYDPRGITNPLIGSVHDPIYQGARKDLADGSIPEPKPGLVTDAHGGILFIDEIGELDITLQNELLKVLEDKRVTFESSYYDPNDKKIPKYIEKLFKDGAPADFILIGATTREPHYLNPALRSRCAEIYFEPLTPEHIQQIVAQAAHKLGITLTQEAAELISQYTTEGRKATNILADAYSIALTRTPGETITILPEDIYTVAQVSRLSPYIKDKSSNQGEIGKIFGLGVAGYMGSIIEIEAIAFPSKNLGKGSIRFNQTAGSMAKDSVFNAASVVRKLTDIDIQDYDIHINVIGGGNIDGPSAGTAILLAIISALQQKPIRQDIAVTGEISIQGKIRPVGGVFEKAYGANQAGIKTMIIPKENAKDIPADLHSLDIHPLETAEEAMKLAFL